MCIGNRLQVKELWYLLYLAELHNMSQSSSIGIAAAASSGELSAVSCGQVMSKDVLFSDI